MLAGQVTAGIRDERLLLRRRRSTEDRVLYSRPKGLMLRTETVSDDVSCRNTRGLPKHIQRFTLVTQ